jgi:dihydrofolate reductase
MRQLVVSEWVTLDGVFDADTMNQWFEPYDSVERQAFITEMVLAAGAFLVGRVTYEMFAGYWPNVKTNDKGKLRLAKTTMLSLGVMSLCYEAAKVAGGVPERSHAELVAM